MELSNISKDVNTLEIKKLFHEALTPQSTIPSDKENETGSDEVKETDEFGSRQYADGKGDALVKQKFIMGKYVIDPIATDFSGKEINCIYNRLYILII